MQTQLESIECALTLCKGVRRVARIHHYRILGSTCTLMVAAAAKVWMYVTNRGTTHIPWFLAFPFGCLILLAYVFGEAIGSAIALRGLSPPIYVDLVQAIRRAMVHTDSSFLRTVYRLQPEIVSDALFSLATHAKDLQVRRAAQNAIHELNLLPRDRSMDRQHAG